MSSAYRGSRASVSSFFDLRPKPQQEDIVEDHKRAGNNAKTGYDLIVSVCKKGLQRGSEIWNVVDNEVCYITVVGGYP